MSDANVDIAVRAVTDAAEGALNDVEGELNNVGEQGEEAAKGVENTEESLIDIDAAAMAAGGALTGVGTAMQSALDTSQGWRESLIRTGESIGANQDEMNELASSISDATMPMDDAVTVLDRLAATGVENQDKMKSLGNTIDDLSDATGTEASTIAQELAPAINGLEGDLDNLEENTDAFALAARDSTLELDDLGQTMQKMDYGAIEEIGLRSDEVAGLMAEFGDQTGYSGELLEQNFNAAVRESDGELDNLLDELGLGQSALDDWNSKVDESEGITKRHADAANESVSTMDKLRSGFEDVQLAAGSALQPISAIAPVMTSVGTAMMGLATINTSALIPSLAGVQAAIVPLMTTILPLIAVVGALAAAWKTDFMGIQGIVENAIGRVQDILSNTGQYVHSLSDQAEIALQRFRQSLQPLIDRLRAFGQQAAQTLQPVQELLQNLATRAQQWLGQLGQRFLSLGQTLTTWGQQAREAVAPTLDRIVSVGQSFLSVVGRIYSRVEPVVQSFRNLATASGDMEEKSARLQASFIQLPGPLGSVLNVWNQLTGAIEFGRQKFAQITPVLTQVGERVIAFGQRVQTALQPVIQQARLTGQAWVQFGQSIINSIGPAMARVQQIGQRIITFGQQARQSLQPVITTVIQVGQKFREFAQGVIQSLQPPLNVLRGQMIETIRHWGGVVRDVLVRAGQLWDQHSDKILAVLEFVRSTIQRVLGVAAQLWDQHGDKVVAVVDFLANKIQVTLGIIGDLWSAHGDKVVTVVDFFTDYVGTVLSVFSDTIISTFAALFAVLRGDTDEALNILQNSFKRSLNAVKSFVTEWGGRLLGAFKGVIDDILQAFRDFGTDLIGNSIIPDILSDVMSAVTNFDLAGAFDGVVDDALGSVTDFKSDFMSAGSGLAGSVADGIKDGISDIENAATDAASAMRDKLPGSDAKEGPLSDLTDSTQAIPNMLADDLSSGAGQVGQAATKMADQAVPEPSSTTEFAEASRAQAGATSASRSSTSSGSQTVEVEVLLEVLGDGPLADFLRERIEASRNDRDRQDTRKLRRNGAADT